MKLASKIKPMDSERKASGDGIGLWLRIPNIHPPVLMAIQNTWLTRQVLVIMKGKSLDFHVAGL
jgi:hypothetical protein